MTKTQSRGMRFMAILLVTVTMFALCCTTAFAASAKFRLDEKDGGNGVPSELQKFEKVIEQEKFSTMGSKKLGAVKDENGELTDISGTGSETGLFLGANSEGYYFNEVAFQTLTEREQKQILKDFINDCNTVRLSDDSMSYIYDNIDACSPSSAAVMIPLIFDESKADLFGAFKLFQPFNGVVGIVLGIGAIFLITAVLLVTVLDMSFLNIPQIQNVGMQQSENGQGKSDGRPGWITAEAWSAYKEVEDGIGQGQGKYRNANWIYLKRRAVSYIVLGICILYLISGQLSGIISWLLRLVSGFTM